MPIFNVTYYTTNWMYVTRLVQAADRAMAEAFVVKSDPKCYMVLSIWEMKIPWEHYPIMVAD